MIHAVNPGLSFQDYHSHTIMGVERCKPESPITTRSAFDPGVGFEASCILGDSNLNSGLQTFPPEQDIQT